MANNAFPLDEAKIIALFVESIFYGLYLVSFGACMRALFSGAGIHSGINRAMLIVVIIMATLGTLDLALGLRQVLDAFIWYRGPGGATAEFDNISSWIEITRSTCYAIQTLVADLILIYRCFIVYNRRWFVIVLPVIMWTGTLICGSAVSYLSWRLKFSTNTKHLVPFVTTFLVLTMVQNLAITSLIAYRIWSVDCQMKQFQSSSTRQSKLKPINRLIIESGAIYTVSLIIFLVISFCSSNGQYTVSDANIMIIGIVFNMIIVRVRQGRTAEQEATATTDGTFSAHPLSFGEAQTRSTFGNHPLSSFGKTQTDGDAALPVEVNVAPHVVQDVDDDRDSAFVESTGNVEGEHWGAG